MRPLKRFYRPTKVKTLSEAEFFSFCENNGEIQGSSFMEIETDPPRNQTRKNNQKI